MKLTTIAMEFQKAVDILEKIQGAGFEAYFVGGAVRDALLNRPIHDVDIASSAYPEEIKLIFPKTFDVGIEHGTVLVLWEEEQYEITTFRTESVYTDFRRPDKVEFVSDLTQDLERRDFTINAFAMTSQAEIIDLFEGLSDLSHKKIRAVGKAEDRFYEDALRIMRAMRFASELDFDIEYSTFLAMKSRAYLLEKIAIERIFIELNKLLLAKNWRKGLTFLMESESWKFLKGFEEINLNKIKEDFQFKCLEQAWAWLILQFSNFNLKKWKISNDFYQKTSKIISAYSEKKWTLELIYKYGLEIVELVDDLKEAEGENVDRQIAKQIDQQLQIHEKSEILINGKELLEKGYQAGPELGKVLLEIEYKIINNQLKNEKEAIFSYLKL
ncbi:MAG: CCA tRNA nucleotidyltransferase [Lactovum sp.]